MRTIEWTTHFKRECKGKYRATLEDVLFPIVESLAKDKLIEARYCDHALSGNWKDCRNCHIKPDLILIYQKLDRKTLHLLRLGSHSELGL
jgi:mRNA interferase YafQ